MSVPRRTVAALAVAASVLALTGCAGAAGSGSTGDGRIEVVTSTDVYGQIASEIGGDPVAVTPLIASAGQDPHSYEASARDQLIVSRADLIIENGGGYDPFIDALVESSGAEAPVITAVDFTPGTTGEVEHGGDDHAHAEGDDHGHVEGVNEHVWYDPATMAAVADAIAKGLGGLDPDAASTFTANADAFGAEVAELETRLADLAAAHAGEQIFVTEPLPLYLTDAAGLENVTPEAFSEAVEEGQDVPPATLLEALDLIETGEVRVVIVNAQTGGAETAQVVDAAERAGIPVLEFTETLPEGDTYSQWMQRNIDELDTALAP